MCKQAKELAFLPKFLCWHPVASNIYRNAKTITFDNKTFIIQKRSKKNFVVIIIGIFPIFNRIR